MGNIADVNVNLVFPIPIYYVQTFRNINCITPIPYFFTLSNEIMPFFCGNFSLPLPQSKIIFLSRSPNINKPTEGIARYNTLIPNKGVHFLSMCFAVSSVPLFDMDYYQNIILNVIPYFIRFCLSKLSANGKV